MGVLRVSCRPGGAGFVVGVELEGAGARRAAEARGGVRVKRAGPGGCALVPGGLPAVPGGAGAAGRGAGAGPAGRSWELTCSGRCSRRTGTRSGCGTRWRSHLPETRVEVDAGVEGGSAVPWELLRDPVTDGVLALRAGAFVRTHPEAAVPVRVPEPGPGGLRVLLVICRPGGPGGCAVPVGGQPPGAAEPGGAGGVPAGCAAPADLRPAGPGAGGGQGSRVSRIRWCISTATAPG